MRWSNLHGRTGSKYPVVIVCEDGSASTERSTIRELRMGGWKTEGQSRTIQRNLTLWIKLGDEL